MILNVSIHAGINRKYLSSGESFKHMCVCVSVHSLDLKQKDEYKKSIKFPKFFFCIHCPDGQSLWVTHIRFDHEQFIAWTFYDRCFFFFLNHSLPFAPIPRWMHTSNIIKGNDDDTEFILISIKCEMWWRSSFGDWTNGYSPR